MATEAKQVEFTEKSGTVQFAVKVVPGASRTEITGRLGTALKVAVAAPPEGGKANAALIKLLAALCGVRRADITILRGHSQPHKRVAIAGLDAATARARLT